MAAVTAASVVDSMEASVEAMALRLRHSIPMVDMALRPRLHMIPTVGWGHSHPPRHRPRIL